MPMPVTMPAAGEASPYIPSGGERREFEEIASRGRPAVRCARARSVCCACGASRSPLRRRRRAPQPAARAARATRARIRSALRSKRSRTGRGAIPARPSARHSSLGCLVPVRRRQDAGPHEAPVRCLADARRRAPRDVYCQRWQRQHDPPSTSAACVVRRDSLRSGSALEPYPGPLDERSAAHLLRRAGFGGSPDDVRRYAGDVG